MPEQHVKINLSANAIRNLLGDDPHALVQLTEKALAQVAEHLGRRWEKKRIDETVNRIELEMNKRLERWSGMPWEIREPVLVELRVIIGQEVNKAIVSLVNKQIGEYIQRTIDSQVHTVAQLVESKALALVERKVEERVSALMKLASNLG